MSTNFNASQISSVSPQMIEELLLEEALQDLENGDYQDAGKLLKAVGDLSDSGDSGDSGNSLSGLSGLGSTGTTGTNTPLNLLGQLEQAVQNLGNSSQNTGLNNYSNGLGSVSSGLNNTNNSGLGTSYENPFSNLNSFSGQGTSLNGVKPYDSGFIAGLATALGNNGTSNTNNNMQSYDTGFINGFTSAGSNGTGTGTNTGIGNGYGTGLGTGTGVGASESGGVTQHVGSFSADSWGDPHLDATINGSNVLHDLKDANAHTDLIDGNTDFKGGYQVGTKETAATTDGSGASVTHNSEIDTHLGGKNIAVTMNANGAQATVKVGNETLTPGSSVSWHDGQSNYTLAQDADGKVHESADNGNGATMSTTITNSTDHGGLDETTIGANVDIGGFESDTTKSP